MRRGRGRGRGLAIAAVLVLAAGAGVLVVRTPSEPAAVADAATGGLGAPDRNGLFTPPQVGDLAPMRWRRDTDVSAFAAVSRPVMATLDGSSVAVAASDGAVVAVDVTTGALRWRAELLGATEVAVAGDLVHVHASDGIHAVDLRSGQLRWSVPAPPLRAPDDVDVGRIVAADDLIHVVASDGDLTTVGRGGMVVWELRGRDLSRLEGPGSHRLDAGPVVVGDLVIATVAVHRGDAVTGAVYALDTRSGALRWRTPVPRLEASAPVVVDDVVVVATANGLEAMDVASGEVRWRDPRVTDGFVRLGRAGGRVLAIGESQASVRDPADGTPVVASRWTSTQAVLALGGPIPSGGVDLVPVHLAGGDVVLLDPRTTGVMWSAADSAGAQPSVGAGGLLLTPTTDGRLVARDLTDGTVRWEQRIVGSMRCDLTGGGDLTFLVHAGAVHAFHAGEGTVAWSRLPEIPIVGAASADAARVVVVDRAGLLTVLDAADGQPIQQAAAGGDPLGAAAVVGDVAYAAGGTGLGLGGRSLSGWIRAVELVDGRSRWLRYADGPMAFPPTVSGRWVVAVTTDGTVQAYHAGTGEPSWRLALDHPVVAPAVIHGDVVAVADRGGGVVVVELASGEARWQAGLGIALRRHPIVTDDLVVVRGDTRSLVALDLATGEERWRRAFDTVLTSPPAVAGDRAYVGTDGGVRVVDLASGDEVATIEVPAAVVGAPVVGRAGITVCAASGSVVALGR